MALKRIFQLSVILYLVTIILCAEKDKPDNDKDKDGQDDYFEDVEICYDEYGCFPMGPPFFIQPERPLPPPEDPKILDVQLHFYSQKNKNKNVTIPLYGNLTLKDAPFDSNREWTVFIASGGGQGSYFPNKLKDAFLEHQDFNVFIVNTTYAYRDLQALQGTSNARIAGAMLARFIKFLQLKYRMDPSKKIWIVGYGLGAHLAGYVGEKVPIARITGLDPMQEFFEIYPTEVRLDRGDAYFVDVIHTDARPFIPNFGLGMINPIGHVDFYPNGGTSQPGCKSFAWSDFLGPTEFYEFIENAMAVLTSVIYCNHKRALKLFISAIANPRCTMYGHPATMENFLRSVSNGGTGGILLDLTAIRDKCNKTSCAPMGLDTPKSPVRGVVIVTTTPDEPFCTEFDQTVPKPPATIREKLFEWIFTVIGDVAS